MLPRVPRVNVLGWPGNGLIQSVVASAAYLARASHSGMSRSLSLETHKRLSAASSGGLFCGGGCLGTYIADGSTCMPPTAFFRFPPPRFPAPLFKSSSLAAMKLLQ